MESEDTHKVADMMAAYTRKMVQREKEVSHTLLPTPLTSDSWGLARVAYPTVCW